ncbi:hypothetical protein [Orlajensenia leifsoniae]|uniref:Uncharacterized protein n=1 Tax=Orlajensenia leifsoniae TaxID=2561933 RepID=A0A4Y9R5N4_9MICO|nr:hypothetical protein [Leifsonia flava]TFV98993.1 hypothetical protein E4M00_05720 [Leifsonia flava]
MSTVSIAGLPSAIGRVRVSNHTRIETPDLSDRSAVEAIFADAARIVKAERARRRHWSREGR